MPASWSFTWWIVRSDHVLAGAPLRLRIDPRARRLRLRVDRRGGGLTLTVPPHVSQRRALAWAAGHGPWAQAALGSVARQIAIEPGATIPFFGQPHSIEWSESARRAAVLGSGKIIVGGPRDAVERRVVRLLKTTALEVLTAETMAVAALAGVSVARVGVGDPVSRWGSCSSSGTIRYSWRIIMAPVFVRQAMVAHEVAHRVHMNHSARFHALVAQLLGSDPKPARLWLRREGAALHRIGGA